MGVEQCEKCLMDSTVEDWERTPSGCNYCVRFHYVESREKHKQSALLRVIQKLTKNGSGQAKYDCVVGLSGGVDSAYVALVAKRLGLRPLLVHMDNCWNSSEAVANIRGIADSLNLDLEVVVLPWKVQKLLQKAFLESDVVDVDLPYDNSLHEVCYSVARANSISLILGGSNVSTEGIPMPKSWAWHPWDGRNIKRIAGKFGVNLKGYPIFSLSKYFRYRFVHRIHWLDILDYLPEYSKNAALLELQNLTGFKEYGGKHFENTFTRFFQGHILPTKFGIDKRKLHLSNLVVTGQLSRPSALKELNKNPYPNPIMLRQDMEEVITRLGMTASQMESYLDRQVVPHSRYGQDPILRALRFAIRLRDRLVGGQ